MPDFGKSNSGVSVRKAQKRPGSPEEAQNRRGPDARKGADEAQKAQTTGSEGGCSNTIFFIIQMLLPLYKVITLLHAFSTLLSLLIFKSFLKRPGARKRRRSLEAQTRPAIGPVFRKMLRKGPGPRKGPGVQKRQREAEKNPEKAQNPRKSREPTKRSKTQKRHRKGSEDAQRAEGQEKKTFKLTGPTFNLQKPTLAGKPTKCCAGAPGRKPLK